MNHLKDSVVTGMALFAMFFGAGNLIFPPMLGHLSGSEWSASYMGFILTTVGLPLLSILAFLRHQGSYESFTARASSTFGKIYGFLLVVAIGPLLAIPRTGATTYELTLQNSFPQIPSWVGIGLFFIASWFFANNPGKTIDRIGKFMTPVILVSLSAAIIKGIMDPIGTPAVLDNPLRFGDGFVEGYQTMDALGSILIASIIIKSLKEKGYTSKSALWKTISLASLIAGLALAGIYGGLYFLGSSTSAVLSDPGSRSELFLYIMENTMGSASSIFISASVSMACLTTSVGLTAVAGNYFSSLTKGKISYRTVVSVVSIFSAFIASYGVEGIVNLAVPILVFLYPVTIVLVIFNLFDRFVKYDMAYKTTVFITAISGFSEAVLYAFPEREFLSYLVTNMPGYDYGFGWLLPALLAFVLSSVLSMIIDFNEKKMQTIDIE